MLFQTLSANLPHKHATAAMVLSPNQQVKGKHNNRQDCRLSHVNEKPAMLWNFDFPFNKNLWSSSFVLLTGRLSLLLLSLFYYIIDVLGYKRWAFFFRVIGMNSILIYISGIFINWQYTTNGLFKWLAQLVGEPYDKILAGFCALLVQWLFLYFLYKKKAFLRI